MMPHAMDAMVAATTTFGVVIRCAVTGSIAVAEKRGTLPSQIILGRIVGSRQRN